MPPAKRFRAVCWLALLLVACQPAPAQDTFNGVERIVAVGDVHGDFDQFVTVLRAAGVIDGNNRWSGGKTNLVQTGDVLDRGPDSRKVMDLLMELEKEAKRAGGAVHALIGNHEAMNIYGDLRYVSESEYESYRTRNSVEARDRYFMRSTDELKRNAPAGGAPAIDAAYRQKWETEHPLGWVEHRMAFGQGDYGQWLRKHNAVVKVNKLLFLHAGISPKALAFSIRDMNEQIRGELKDFSKLQGGLTMDTDGPLWYRGLAQDAEPKLAPHVDAALAKYGVERIVIGHTVTGGAVLPRVGGKVIMIDVGLSKIYKGPPACLVIEGSKLFALHRGKMLEFPADGADPLPYLKAAAALDPPPSPVLKLIGAREPASQP